MAHTKVTKTGTQNNGTANTFSYSGSFDVFKATEVKVDLDTIALTYTASTINESASPREYTVDVTAKTVHIGGADLAGTNDVVIRPFTDMGAPSPRATYTPGASITSEDLNNNQLQLMRKAMEYDEQKLSSTGGTMTGDLELSKDINITFEGATDDAYETTLTVVDPTADRTISLPNATDTLVGKATTDTLTNKSIDLDSNTVSGTLSEFNAALQGDSFVSLTGSETLTNKTLASPTITTQFNIGSATITEAELEIIDGATVSTAELNKLDGATASTTELNYVTGVTSGIQSQIDGKQPLDADLTELSSMQTGAAAKLKVLTADEIEKIDGLTATTAELNKIDGYTGSATDLNIVASMTKQTTITDQDTSYPTSGAVVDYVAAQIAPIGGLEVIATDAAFPNDQPASGVVISIADAGGLVVNGSGQSTTGRTVGASTVTINGINSSFHSTTIDAGIGMLVTSTGAGQIYNYHKTVIKEADVAQISDDINDFNSRYRIGNSDPGSDNDEGDLFFNKTANKMKVYDGSSWGEVTSTGEFKYLVLCNAGTTNAATYNGSDVSYDLKETSTSGSAASVTSAAQLIVSINGVIQKPNTGTNTSGLDGFVMTDADTIKFSAGPPANAEVFVVQIGSAVSVSVPANDSVTAAKLDLPIVAGDVIYGSGTDTWARLAKPASNKFLRNTSGGSLSWETVDSTPEGTAIKSTGESGASKYLREDGDGTCSWQEVVGAVADGCIFENDQTISNNYTIASGKGAHSVGPITVNATVTVNGNWVVS